MKKSLCLLLAASMVAAPVFAESLNHGPSVIRTPSDLSVAAGLSVAVVGSMAVLAVPVLVIESVKAVGTGVAKGSQVVQLQLSGEKGKTTVDVPANVVEKAKLKAGDKLDVKKTQAGAAMLYKDDTPIAYVAPEGAGTLSRSHELTK